MAIGGWFKNEYEREKNQTKKAMLGSWKEIVHTLLAILNMKGSFGTDRDYVVVLSQ